MNRRPLDMRIHLASFRTALSCDKLFSAKDTFIVEGEKYAKVVTDHGYVATTLDSGANSKWLDENLHYYSTEKRTPTVRIELARNLSYFDFTGFWH